MFRRATLRTAALCSIAGFILTPPVAAQTVEDLQRQIDALQAQINALKAQQEAAAQEAAAQEAARVAAEDRQVPQAEKAAGNNVNIEFKPSPVFSSADGDFEFKVRGRLFLDAGWVDPRDGDKTDSTEFRAARIGVDGTAWGNFDYRLEVDFADNEVDMADAFIGYDFGAAGVRVGHFKTANSLEEVSSARYITFLERGGVTDAFRTVRETGIELSTNGDNWSATAGAYKGDADGGNGNRGETFSARLTYAPVLEKGRVLHLGAHVRHRSRDGDDGLIRYRQRPHNHLANRYIDTGAIAESDMLLGAELYGIMGPFSLLGEYMTVDVDLPIENGFSDPTFKGWFVDGAWVLTGESPGYKGSSGTMARLKVANPVGEGGFGALQLAVRFDHVDLTDEGIFGGEQDTWVLGLNWHLNNYVRVMLNYSTSDVKQAFDVDVNGADGDNSIDTLGMRFQVDW